jgi:hypothetical protein
MDRGRAESEGWGGEMRDCMVYFLAEDLGILFLLEAIVRRLLNR